MLWMLSALLLVLWLAAMVSGGAGAWVHVLLLLAAIAVIASLVQGDRYDSI